MQSVIIISAERSNLSTTENLVRSANLFTKLSAIANPIKATGSYLGQTEQSFIIEDTRENRELAIQLGKEYDQDCVGIVTSDSVLYYVSCEMSTKSDMIGLLKFSETMPNSDGWTHTSDGYYYV